MFEDVSIHTINSNILSVEIFLVKNDWNIDLSIVNTSDVNLDVLSCDVLVSLGDYIGTRSSFSVEMATFGTIHYLF